MIINQFGFWRRAKPYFTPASTEMTPINAGDIISNQSVNIFVGGYDPTNQSLTHTIESGSLPNGLSLNPAGYLTGTAGSVAQLTNYYFTVRATNENNDYTLNNYLIRVGNIVATQFDTTTFYGGTAATNSLSQATSSYIGTPSGTAYTNWRQSLARLRYSTLTFPKTLNTGKMYSEYSITYTADPIFGYRGGGMFIGIVDSTYDMISQLPNYFTPTGTSNIYSKQLQSLNSGSSNYSYVTYKDGIWSSTSNSKTLNTIGFLIDFGNKQTSLYANNVLVGTLAMPVFNNNFRMFFTSGPSLTNSNNNNAASGYSVVANFGGSAWIYTPPAGATGTGVFG